MPSLLSLCTITFPPPGHFSSLVTTNRQTQSMIYTRNSARNVVSHIKQWVVFCLHFSKPIIPAAVEDLVAFLELMARGSGYGHIKTVIGSLKFLHKALNVHFPEDSFQLNTTLRGMKRRLAKTPFQVLPITPFILRKMFIKMNIEDPEQLATWCSFLVCFYSLFRKSSIIPDVSYKETSGSLSRGNFIFKNIQRPS